MIAPSPFPTIYLPRKTNTIGCFLHEKRPCCDSEFICRISGSSPALHSSIHGFSPVLFLFSILVRWLVWKFLCGDFKPPYSPTLNLIGDRSKHGQVHNLTRAVRSPHSVFVIPNKPAGLFTPDLFSIFQPFTMNPCPKTESLVHVCVRPHAHHTQDRRTQQQATKEGVHNCRHMRAVLLLRSASGQRGPRRNAAQQRQKRATPLNNPNPCGSTRTHVHQEHADNGASSNSGITQDRDHH